MRTAVTSFLLSVSLFAPAAAAEIIVVDQSSGDVLQDAIDAAAPGDTLLLQGTSLFTAETAAIVGKGLTLIGDAPGFDPAFVLRRIAIRNLPAGQDVIIVHMNLAGPGGNGLILTNNVGSVRLFDVSTVGGIGKSANISGQQAEPGFAGAYVKNCDDVVFVRSAIRGGHGGNVQSGQGTATSPGGIGLEIDHATVTLYDSGAIGGEGGQSGFIFAPLGSDGGTGAVNDGGRLYLFNSATQGGAGGENDGGGAHDVSGGLGFLQTGAGAAVQLRDGSFVGGVGVGFSPDGAASDIVDGTLDTFPTQLGRLELADVSPLREGEAITLLGQGMSGGTRVFLAFSFGPGLLPLPSREGVFTLGLPLAGELLFVGTSGPNNSIDHYPLGNVPELPVGFDEVHLFLQAIESSMTGEVTLGTPEHLTLLDASF